MKGIWGEKVKRWGKKKQYQWETIDFVVYCIEHRKMSLNQKCVSEYQISWAPFLSRIFQNLFVRGWISAVSVSRMTLIMREREKNAHAHRERERKIEREKDRKLAAEHPRLISYNWSGSFAARLAMLIEE